MNTNCTVPCRPWSPLTKVKRLVGLTLAMVLSLALWGAEAIPDDDCLQCHGDRELSKTNADGRTLSLFVDTALLRSSVHATNTCASCHADIGTGHPDDGVAVKPVTCAQCHGPQSASYGASVHGRAVEQGTGGAATCADCHGTHQILSHRSVDSPLDPRHIVATCGTCHDDVAREVQASVHGKALADGRRDAPTCVDCHAEHQIETLKTASPIQQAQSTCSRCHASERINAKYRLPGDRVKTFLGSYHGLAARLGSTRAANCASCHGVHKILPSTDPESTIHPSHLVETCGRCHPGANENFALSKVHVDEVGEATDPGSMINRWVRRIYLVLIVGTIGGFAMHNLLIWMRKALAARRAMDRAEIRMTRGQRLQHLVLAASFILLAWSGFALKYPDSWLSWLLGADEDIRRWTHRGAALAMIALAVYHALYLAFTREGRETLRDFWPARHDMVEALTNLRYAFGRHPHHAHAKHRFGYVEKIEYWAVAWGTVIMGVTGFMVWFPVEVTKFLPRWTIDVATTIHFYEAILACLAIVVWHFYHVIFDPDVYPLNWAFWDGHGPKRPNQSSPAPGSGPASGTASRQSEGADLSAS